MSATRSFFTDEQVALIGSAIAQAEDKTSGEIRVHLDTKCKIDPIVAAEKWFGKLNMHKTELRNGVLIYLAIESKVFAIYGDKGINDRVPANFWNEISKNAEQNFRQGKFVEGLTEAIRSAGDQLARFFPRQADDKNELPNDISFK